MSDVARNIGVVERLERAYDERDYDTVRACLAPDFVSHTARPELPPGVEGAIAVNEGTFAMYPDKRTEILEIFGEGDRVVVHVRFMGTNDGDMPYGGMSATGRPVDFDWIQISRHGDDGRVQETWAQMDIAKMMTQLGAMPAPEGT